MICSLYMCWVLWPVPVNRWHADSCAVWRGPAIVQPVGQKKVKL